MHKNTLTPAQWDIIQIEMLEACRLEKTGIGQLIPMHQVQIFKQNQESKLGSMKSRTLILQMLIVL